MVIFKSLLLAAMLHRTMGQSDEPIPVCAIRCWENTMYVSRCVAEDWACLCIEQEYQNRVFQCLYSQCDAPDFSPALRHTTSHCSKPDDEPSNFTPPVPNHEELRKREAEYAAGTRRQCGSGSDMDFPTQSASYHTQSVGYLTKSANNPYSPTSTPVTISSPPPYFPLITAAFTAATTPSLFSTLSPQTSASLASNSSATSSNSASYAIAGPDLYTGIATIARPAVAGAVLSTILALYLSSRMGMTSVLM